MNLDIYEFGGQAELLADNYSVLKVMPVSFILVLAPDASPFFMAGARKAIAETIVEAYSGAPKGFN